MGLFPRNNIKGLMARLPTKTIEGHVLPLCLLYSFFFFQFLTRVKTALTSLTTTKQ